MIDIADAFLVDRVYERINKEGRSLVAIEEELDHLAKEGIHTQQFPSQRASQINSLRERVQTAKLDLQPYEGVIRSLGVEKQLGSRNVIELGKQAAETVAKIDKVLAEATKALANVQTKAMERGVETAKSTFDALAVGHARQALGWFLAFVLAAALTTWAVLHGAVAAEVPRDLTEALIIVFRRLLLISVPAVFMKVALSKYNLERNLRIVYSHREAVLAQYRTFEAAIGNDAAAKNQFRLEIAKYVFSDPVTGYVLSDAGAEININPVISLLDKVMPGGK